MEDRCIQITERQWGRVVRTKLSVAEYEGRRNESTFGYLRLLRSTPHASALTSRPGPGFHAARVINQAEFERQMTALLGLA